MENPLTFAGRWFFAPIDVRPLFVARAGFGSILLYHYAKCLPWVPDLFGPRGIAGAETFARWPTFSRSDWNGLENFRVLHHVESMPVIWLLYAALLLASACFAIGLFTRASGLVAIALHVVFNAHQPSLTWGWALMIQGFSLYVVLGGGGRAFSVDALLARRRGSAPIEPWVMNPWGLRLLSIHAALMYFVAGWDRLDHAGWLEGSVVFSAVVDSRFARFGFDWFALKPVLRVATWVVFALEPLAPIALWIPKLGKWWAVALIGMHLGIEAVADVGMWQLTMATAVLVFLPAGWFERILPTGDPRG